TTRTYRVEIEVPNADGNIPDGITAEVVVPLLPVLATRVPRSALTFSSTGNLGLRVVDANDTVEFAQVGVIEDAQRFMVVPGPPERSRVIVQGQDFVREGQTVDAVGIPELTAVAQYRTSNERANSGWRTASPPNSVHPRESGGPQLRTAAPG